MIFPLPVNINRNFQDNTKKHQRYNIIEINIKELNPSFSVAEVLSFIGSW